MGSARPRANAPTLARWKSDFNLNLGKKAATCIWGWQVDSSRAEDTKRNLGNKISISLNGTAAAIGATVDPGLVTSNVGVPSSSKPTHSRVGLKFREVELAAHCEWL